MNTHVTQRDKRTGGQTCTSIASCTQSPTKRTCASAQPETNDHLAICTGPYFKNGPHRGRGSDSRLTAVSEVGPSGLAPQFFHTISLRSFSLVQLLWLYAI